MKTICRPSNHEDANISLYLFEDEDKVSIRDDLTIIGDEEDPSLVILDCTSTTAVLYENVSKPEEYKGWKYCYSPETGWVDYEGWPEIEANIKRALDRFRPPSGHYEPAPEAPFA